MTEKRKLVMATNNAGKLREVRAIAGDKLEILSLNDIGFHEDIEETSDTLAGNALLKVRAVKKVCDYDVFADDTGLMVDALGGEPGVHTARYAGEDCNPDANIELMLKNMEGMADRRAHFSTCIALSHNGEEQLFEGTAEGMIATRRSGSHGFGYDPIFISAETGKCFAEMSEDDKNAISHRGRALSAMMKWLGALCLSMILSISAHAASYSSDWTLYNTFDDAVEWVFDTPSKTYYLAQAQLYNTAYVDNNEKLYSLFCLEKESDEVRAYNAQNFLSRSIISIANYNAQKKYLMIVYDNLMIDFLYDDGKVFSLEALKNFGTSSSKQVRSINFDAENNRAYLSTDFGFVAINDEKHEVASSGIYNQPIDYTARIGNKLVIISDGKVYADNISSPHISFSDFKEEPWALGYKALGITPISSDKALYSKDVSGAQAYYVLTFSDDNSDPESRYIWNLKGSKIAENKNGLFLSNGQHFVQVDKNTGEVTEITGRDEDAKASAGSWDFKEVFFAMPREGFYSLRHDGDNTWTSTREVALPNAPSAFRSNMLSYSPGYGMLVNSHGIDQNFSAYTAPNPILLSSLKDGHWTPLGFPYLDPEHPNRLINPCGFAQDPDNPDIFYFGSFMNGLLRYNVKDMSSLLHITRNTDQPNLPGHVPMPLHATWSSIYSLPYPKFDKSGNLVVTHFNTDSPKYIYDVELWIWTPEKRRASVSPETFQPFKVLKINDVHPTMMTASLPLNSGANSNMVMVMTIDGYDKPFAIYDHNGTIEDETDDRQVTIRSTFDQDGAVSFHDIYCAFEDQATGLVWVGTDNGVFTFDPKAQFSSPGSVNRIKVSRNDGTSLADYLLDGISINNITADDKNRKWFSLSSGGVVCTSSDGKTIIEEISSDNSMLPSDNVYATCYNPSDNSMMIATESGLCEYHLAGQGGEVESKARAYPNPVRPDYYGWVTIDGLEDDCIVKIVDSAGNLIREIGPASGGRVQWDACNANLERVSSGVYFVLASSGPGGGSYSEATKILVIKQ